MDKDRINELAAEIVAGTKNAVVDIIALFGFIQAIIQAIQECRGGLNARQRRRLSVRIGKRVRRKRTADIARLADNITPYLQPDQDPNELAQRTFDVAGELEESELDGVVRELETAGMAW